MEQYICWSERRFSEIKEPILVNFEIQNRERNSSLDRISSRFGNTSLYSSRFCLPSKTAEYQNEMGDFTFGLDSNGNAIIVEFFASKCAYVKLPSVVYDTSGQCYPIKRVDGIAGGNCLKGLYIPEGIEVLGGNFAGSYTLLDVFFPKSLTFFGSIFWNIPQFEKNDGGRVWYPGSREEWEKLLDSDKNRGSMDYTPYDKVVRFYVQNVDVWIPEIDIKTGNGKKSQRANIRVCNKEGDIVVPATWREAETDLVVTRIGRNSFACNELLTRVTIPPSVHAIARDAFYGCTSLREVMILEGADDLIIEEGAFFNCTDLRRIILKRNARIGDYAFACEKNTGVELEVSSKHQLQLCGEKAFLNRVFKQTTT